MTDRQVVSMSGGQGHGLEQATTTVIGQQAVGLVVQDPDFALRPQGY